MTTATYLPMMQPVLRRGRSTLDRDLLPGDENESRLTALLSRAAEQGLDGVVVIGASHLPQDLAYYANYIPTTFHGVLIARAGHPPTLLAGKGGARDHPYIRTVSWVGDIRYAADIGQAIAEITGDWPGGTGKLGVAGLDTALPFAVRDGVVSALGDRIVQIDELVREQRRHKSARELTVLKKANELATRAAVASAEAATGGAGRRSALAAADYAARAGGAHDCRISAGTELGGIATMAEVTDQPGPFSAVVAVEYLGYWGLAGVTTGSAGTESDIEAFVARLRPGTTPRDAVEAESSDTTTYVVNGIGCDLAEAPTLGDAPALVDGDVLAVVRQRRGPNGLELAVRTVVVGAEGGSEI